MHPWLQRTEISGSEWGGLALESHRTGEGGRNGKCRATIVVRLPWSQQDRVQKVLNLLACGSAQLAAEWFVTSARTTLYVVRRHGRRGPTKLLCHAAVDLAFDERLGQ